MKALSDAEKAIMVSHPVQPARWSEMNALQGIFPSLRAAYDNAYPKAAVGRLIATEGK
jgi:hypothetical protein